MEGSVAGETVVQGVVKGQQVHIMHGQVICVIPALKEPHIYQRGAVKPVVVHLVDDKNPVSYFLFVEEAVHEGNKDQQFLKPLPERHHQGQFVRSPAGRVRVLVLVWVRDWGTRGRGPLLNCGHVA